MKTKIGSYGLMLLLAMGAAGCATGKGAGEFPFLVGEVEKVGEERVSAQLSLGGYLSASDGSPYRTYGVELDRGEIVRVVVESGEFLPGIAFYSPEGELLGRTERDHYGGMNRVQLIRRAPQKGRYLVVVSSGSHRDFGAFEIRTQRLQEEQELVFPGKVQGYLFGGRGVHPTTGAAVGVHTLEVEEPTVVEIVLESQDFDPFVSLVNGETEEILMERYQQGQGARIVTELPTGSYEIWASSSTGGRDGRYRLEVKEAELERSESFELGSNYTGFLSWERARIPATMRSGMALSFELDEAAVLDVVMRSTDFDAYLVLTDDQGNLVTEDDDSGGNMDARIIWPLQPGSYLLWATSFGEEETGGFRIESSLREPTEGTSRIEVGERREGVLTQASQLYAPRGTYINYYELVITESMEVTIDLGSMAFDAYLVLEDESGQLITENDDAFFGTTDAQVTHRLAPGRYRIGVTTYGRDSTGAYQLEVERAAPSGQSV